MRACLFDIDGTLLSSGGAGKAAFSKAFEEEFGVTAPIAPRSISGRTDRSIARDQFALHGIDDSDANWRRVQAAYLRHLPDMLHAHTGAVLPGIIELLNHLTQRTAVAVGLLTGNMADGARVKLSHYKLAAYFQFGAFGDKHLNRDEVAHDALRLVSRRLTEEVAAEAVWVVGDTPHDIRCARAIGARCVAVATGIHTAEELDASEPDLLLHDCSDLDPILRLLV